MTNWKRVIAVLVLLTGALDSQTGSSGEPRILRFVAPPYPPMARVAQIAGTVTVALRVRVDGEVENVKTVSGHRMLAGHVEQALKKWRFYAQQQPTDLTVTVRFCFAGERARRESTFAPAFVSAELPTHVKIAVSPPPHPGGDVGDYPAVAPGDTCEED